MSTPTKSRTLAPAAEAWRLMRELFAANQPRFMGMFAAFGLSKQQAIALHLLDPDEPVAMSELAGAMYCDASNITGIVDRLEERGLVERRSAEHDRRLKLLVLTAEGATVREQVIEALGEPPAQIAELSAADQRGLRDILLRALGR